MFLCAFFCVLLCSVCGAFSARIGGFLLGFSDLFLMLMGADFD
ncbi:hypothetical protein PORCRE_461 [Porphyromonas crevioricanis JCM 15906]|uniref:Uncharacterized protein n=1 Tax=Porphyromonas crevioricanis JCM 15906 TaxID=1305617 RepID=T1DQI0_9PORP|nr:hypothetical protein PORCRE_461 [Porphyromonas crevioricanis JCM 15906]GAD08199.1 hypothetical protein PORCAN_1835 [Porphyromonas crevioricanis JCM 13913]